MAVVDTGLRKFTNGAQHVKLDSNAVSLDATTDSVDVDGLARQRVQISGELAEQTINPQVNGGIARLPTLDDEVTQYLNKILQELRLLNLHISTMTGENFTANDIRD